MPGTSEYLWAELAYENPRYRWSRNRPLSTMRSLVGQAGRRPRRARNNGVPKSNSDRLRINVGAHSPQPSNRVVPWRIDGWRSLAALGSAHGGHVGFGLAGLPLF